MANESMVFLVNGNNFILITTKNNLAKLYNVIAIKVAKAAPFNPKFGIKYIFKKTIKATNMTPKNKTVLQYFELKIIALLFPRIKSKYFDNPIAKTTNNP